MSAGTEIISDALKLIGAVKRGQSINEEDIIIARDTLNSMLHTWLTKNIDIGFTPLDAPGDELSEPQDTRNGITSNLAIKMAPYFDNGRTVVSVDLKNRATFELQEIKATYQKIQIPLKIASSTLPIGQGNRTNGFFGRIYKGKGGTVNG